MKADKCNGVYPGIDSDLNVERRGKGKKKGDKKGKKKRERIEEKKTEGREMKQNYKKMVLNRDHEKTSKTNEKNLQKKKTSCQYKKKRIRHNKSPEVITMKGYLEKKGNKDGREGKKEIKPSNWGCRVHPKKKVQGAIKGGDIGSLWKNRETVCGFFDMRRPEYADEPT